MKYFANCSTLDELKKAYRRLAMENHPDRGGSLDAMKEINAEYEARFNALKAQQNAAASAENSGVKWTDEVAADFVAIIDQLIHLDGLTIELCGSWLWISGETYRHREALKAAGCRWSRSKSSWYWRPAGESSYRYRGKATLEDIRQKYGSARIASAPAARLSAV